jgi:carbon-monoxide dehydrogenase medium subunit
VKPAPFDYVAPATVEEALGHLERAGGDVAILAGGQTLLPLLALRMSTPSVVVDINRIDALKGVTRTAEAMRIAAVTRQNEALASAPLKAALPVLVEAMGNIGHHQTRNRGTVGGSIAPGEPAAEQPASAVALGAMLELTSTRGTRTIPADEFYLGPYMTSIEPDELLTGITFPDWPKGHTMLFREVTQRPGDFALVGLVGALALDGGTISQAGLAWFGMGPTPVKAWQAESALFGAKIADLDFRELAELSIHDAEPFDDHAATADYRRSVARRIFARTLQEALSAKEMA